jgi:subtilisin family serine protease
VRRALSLFLSLALLALALPVSLKASAARQTSGGSKLKATQEAEFVPGEVLVRFRRSSPVVAATERTVRTNVGLLMSEGGEMNIEIERFDGSDIVPGLRFARVNPEATLQAVEALSAREDVLYAEPNYVRRRDAAPNDPNYPQQWALKNTGQVGFNDYTNQQAAGIPGADIDAELAWNTTTGSRSVVVGVIDEGIDINHPDLQANIWRNPAETAGNSADDDGNGKVDDINGWDFYHNDGSVYDGAAGDNNTDAHGTHVAGTIGAVGNNGQGITGVNWQVSIMSLKILGKECPDDNPQCDPAAPSNVRRTVAAYNYAKLMRDKFVQTGGGQGANLRVLNNSYGGGGRSQSEIDAINQLASSGILFVAAAGNQAANNTGFPHYPSDYNLQNMISVAATDRFEQIAIFSDFGLGLVHMGAPGRGIVSTTPNNTYSAFSGTSMAAPHVAGAAALILSQFPDVSVNRLRNSLVFSGDPVAQLSGKVFSGRRLNVNNSLQAIAANDNALPGSIGDFRLISQCGRNVTLGWTAPGDNGSGGGPAALYEITFNDPNNPGLGTRLLATKIPGQPGTQETITVSIPYQSLQGSISISTYDKVGANSGGGIVNVSTSAPFANPYAVSTQGAGSLSGGAGINLKGDDVYRENHALPFAFPFFGKTYSSVTVSSNGALYFAPLPNENGVGMDAGSSIAGLETLPMIAGMWDDLRTDRNNGDVFVTQSGTSIIFRWQGTTFDTPLTSTTSRGENPINFEIELRSDGTIIFRYGSGNTSLFPVVGISAGEARAFVVTSHTSENSLINLTNAATVVFTPPPPPPPSFFQFSASSYTAGEDGGSATVTVTRTGDAFTAQSVNIGTGNGTADHNSDYNSLSGALSFAPCETSKTVRVSIINDTAAESGETVNLMLTNPTNGANLGSPNTAVLTIQDDDSGIGANSVAFGAATASVGEGDRRIQLTVNRSGDTSKSANVFYQTGGGSASDRSDYSIARGVLRFAANETSKTIEVFITDDVFQESAENFNVTLSSPVHTSLGAQTSVTVTINDNDPATGANPVRDATFNSDFFVRQHYVDFFNREGDAGGVAFWKNQIDECTTQECREVRRINVSAAFFVSTEFQQTGFLVYLTHQAAFGTGEQLRLNDFMADTQEIGRGVIVNVGAWQQQLEANKQRFFDEFVSRPQFVAAHQHLNPQQFVETLNSRTGNSLTPAQAVDLGARLSVGLVTRAQALREVAENAAFGRREYTRAFVLMQYFGYLRRNPNDPPQPGLDYSGYNFWLSKLNSFGGNYITSEMVKAFITSGEYQERFGS